MKWKGITFKYKGAGFAAPYKGVNRNFPNREK